MEYQYEEIKAALLIERIVEANVGWKSLFMTAGNRRRMRVIIAIAFFSQWSGNGLLSYCMSTNLSGTAVIELPQIWLRFSTSLAVSTPKICH